MTVGMMTVLVILVATMMIALEADSMMMKMTSPKKLLKTILAKRFPMVTKDLLTKNSKSLKTPNGKNSSNPRLNSLTVNVTGVCSVTEISLCENQLESILVKMILK